MSDTQQRSETTVRLGRRFVPLIGAVGIMCVLALFAVLRARATRPTWYTVVTKPFRSPFTPPAYSLVLRVPFGWEWRETPRDTGINTIDVQIRRKPLTGVKRWPKQDENRMFIGQKTTGTYHIQMSIATEDPPFHEDYYAPDKWVKRSQASFQEMYANIGQRMSHLAHNPHLTTAFRSFDHALGPAFTMTVALSATGSGAGKHRMPFWRFDLTDIYMKQPHHLVIVVTAEHGDPQTGPDRFQSTWNAIVRSIRVVRK